MVTIDLFDSIFYFVVLGLPLLFYLIAAVFFIVTKEYRNRKAQIAFAAFTLIWGACLFLNIRDFINAWETVGQMITEELFLEGGSRL